MTKTLRIFSHPLLPPSRAWGDAAADDGHGGVHATGVHAGIGGHLLKSGCLRAGCDGFHRLCRAPQGAMQHVRSQGKAMSIYAVDSLGPSASQVGHQSTTTVLLLLLPLLYLVCRTR